MIAQDFTKVAGLEQIEAAVKTSQDTALKLFKAGKDTAQKLYQAELAAPGGMRGDAGARLVALEYAQGRREFQEWARCEGFLRSELDDANRFKDHVTQLSKFHRAVVWPARRYTRSSSSSASSLA